MKSSKTPNSTPKLSICIPTYNRAQLIGSTLNSILHQLTDECEIAISDNASTDETAEVVHRYMQSYESIRYQRNATNLGLDRNLDCAVQMSSGEYCWLMTDDDVLKPGAVRTVLKAIETGDYSLVVVNYERRNYDLSKILLPRAYEVSEDHIYLPEHTDKLAIDGSCLMVCSCLVLRRSLWLERQKERYFGSLFVHVGVIFQQQLPSPALMISPPLIEYRDGHSRSFWADLFEILMITWPALIWSLPLSPDAKKQVVPEQPWRYINRLLLFRGAGWYTLTEYRKFVKPRLRWRGEGFIPMIISIVPGRLLNRVLLLYYPLANPKYARLLEQFLQQSPFYGR